MIKTGKKQGRISRLQRAILAEICKGTDYSDLRATVEDKLRIENGDSFKVSYSRAIKSLAEKKLIRRATTGFRLGRSAIRWEAISLTDRGKRTIGGYFRKPLETNGLQP